MTINYLDSKRISGLSSDIVETATYTDDFDTDDWDNMSSRINVNTTTEKLDFAMYRDGANDSAVHDLGVGNVSDTKWVLRWKMNFTAVYASGNGNRLWFGLSSLPQTTAQNSAQDSIMMYQNHDFNDSFSASYSNGSGMPQTNTETPDYATGTDYYCELKRTSSTTIESRMWTGGYDGTLLSSAEDSVSNSDIANVTGLRYVKMSNIKASQGGSVITGTIDDIEFYNGVSSLSSKPTNVQDNSILVEKDTGKRYWFDGSTWIWGNPILPTVAGLKLHLDASDSSTITIATGVSQWNDKSGQGNHVTQATGSKQPLLVNSSLNGKAVIRFNGTDEWMSRTSYTGGTLTQPTSIFGVYSWPSGSTTRRVLDSANNSSRHVIYLGSAGQHGIFAGSELLGAGSPNSTDRLQYTALFNTTSSSLRKSKTTILSGTTGTQIMDGIMLAASSGTNSFGDIDIAELLVYNATVSTVDRDAIEDYLTVKWGL